MKLTEGMIKDSRWYEIIISKSGSRQLNDIERSRFILNICEHNVLLAALCKSNSHNPEPELEFVITKKAVEIAQNSVTALTSGIGIRALAEIGKFNEIAKIFKETERTSEFNKNIVTDFVTQADENQIIDFLEILVNDNFALFLLAIDRLYQLEKEFSHDSKNKIKSVLLSKVGLDSYLVLVRFITTFKIKIEGIDLEKIIDFAFIKGKAKRGIEIIYLYNYQKEFNYEKYLKSVFQESTTQQDILTFINYLKEQKIEIEIDWIILLTNNLNPQIKQLGISYAKSYKNSFDDILIKIIENNLNLNVFSSIKYAYDLVVEFNLESKFPLKFIGEKLFELSTPKSLFLAYQLLVENGTDISYCKLIIERLLQKTDHQAIQNAVQIIFKTDSNYKITLLELAIKLKKSNINFKKLSRYIITNYVSPCQSIHELKVGDTLYAVVLTYFKGDESDGYVIQIGSIKKNSFFPTTNYPYRIKGGTIVKVKITNINELEEKVNVDILDNNVEKRVLNSINKGKSSVSQNKFKKSDFGEKLQHAIFQKDNSGFYDCEIKHYDAKYIYVKLLNSNVVGLIDRNETTLLLNKFGLISKGSIIKARRLDYYSKNSVLMTVK